MRRTRIIKPMTEEMKEELRQKRQLAEISQKCREESKKNAARKRDPKKQTWILPEDFTGKDLKRALVLIKRRK